MERAPMMQDEHIQTLIEFGLTFLQAKTYLALAKLGKANVKAIAKASNVARQDIYRIMLTLEKLGLGEKIIAKPTMYKATPVNEALSILLQNRKEELAELQKKTTSLINNFQEKKAKTPQEDRIQFIITSEITRFLKMHKSLTQQAQTSIDGIIHFRVSQPKFHEALSTFKGAIRRGVKMRLVAEHVEKQFIPPELEWLEKHALFELKYAATTIHFGMFIFDKKEVTLATTTGGLPSLWSNNPNVVKLANSYFTEMWNRSTAKSITEYPLKINRNSQRTKRTRS